MSATNKGYVIYTLGTDTTFIGSYQLHDNEFQFKVMARPDLSATILRGSFFPNGELKEAAGYGYKPNRNGEDERQVDYELSVDTDSTFIKQVRDGKESLYKFQGRAMIANALGTPFLLFLPVLVNYAPKKSGESVESYHFVLGQKRNFTIKKISADLLEMGSQVMGYFKIYLHPNGKLKFIDGIGSSWNVKGEVFDELDIDFYIQQFTSTEEATSLKPLNKEDSVLTTINDVSIRIDYSRPSRRGRVILVR